MSGDRAGRLLPRYRDAEGDGEVSRALKRAIDAGDVERVRKLVSKDPSLVSSSIRWGGLFNKCQTEPLHYLSDAPFNQIFSHGKQAEMARVLLEAGASPNGAPTSGETPLHGAASLGEAGVAAALIDHGADLEAVASYPGIPHGRPLDFAVHFGMVAVIDLLVAQGAKILSARMAAGAGQLDMISGENCEWPIEDGEKLDVFRCAAVCDRLGVVDHLLVKAGVDVNTDIDGATALHWAAWEAKPKMVEFLLSRGADATIRDRKHKMTARQWAEHRGKELGPRWGHREVVDVLDREATG